MMICRCRFGPCQRPSNAESLLVPALYLACSCLPTSSSNALVQVQEQCLLHKQSRSRKNVRNLQPPLAVSPDHAEGTGCWQPQERSKSADGTTQTQWISNGSGPRAPSNCSSCAKPPPLNPSVRQWAECMRPTPAEDPTRQCRQPLMPSGPGAPATATQLASQ
jgi:hypothetical protein